ncbi:MAG: hypothetical protein PF445_03925 [Melioribacteraceae bacterium]|jgi:hypothetical protein|nr:hypothetical protein [Melioribacteraceae bacterium]
MNYDPDRIKQQIQAEADLYPKFGPGRIWQFVVRDIFKNDTAAAKEFLLSPAGGFDESEIEKIVQKQETFKASQIRAFGTEIYT